MATFVVHNSDKTLEKIYTILEYVGLGLLALAAVIGISIFIFLRGANIVEYFIKKRKKKKDGKNGKKTSN